MRNHFTWGTSSGYFYCINERKNTYGSVNATIKTQEFTDRWTESPVWFHYTLPTNYEYQCTYMHIQFFSYGFSFFRTWATNTERDAYFIAMIFSVSWSMFNHAEFIATKSISHLKVRPPPPLRVQRYSRLESCWKTKIWELPRRNLLPYNQVQYDSPRRPTQNARNHKIRSNIDMHPTSQHSAISAKNPWQSVVNGCPVVCP